MYAFMCRHAWSLTQRIYLCLFSFFLSGMAMIDYQLLIGIPRVYRTNSNVCFAELRRWSDGYDVQIWVFPKNVVTIYVYIILVIVKYHGYS